MSAKSLLSSSAKINRLFESVACDDTKIVISTYLRLNLFHANALFLIPLKTFGFLTFSRGIEIALAGMKRVN